MEPKDGALALDVCNATTVPIVMKNTGEKSSGYVLSVKEGPAWVYISPDSVYLDSGEEKIIYLYITPPFEAESGAYIVTVNARSDHAQFDLRIPFTLGTNVTVHGGEANITGENVTSGVSLNVTFPENNITGLIITKGDTWKVLVVGIITILIIIILVIRFALLIKK